LIMKSRNTALILCPVFWPNLPPIGLAYLKGYLAANDIHVKCVDINNIFFNESTQDLKAEWKKQSNPRFENMLYDIVLERFRSVYELVMGRLLGYDIVGMSCYRSNYEFSIKLAREIKRRRPSTKIVLGGPEIRSRFHSHRTGYIEGLRGTVDVAVIGEGERPILDVITGKIYQGMIAYDELSVEEDIYESDYTDFTFSAYPVKKKVSILSSRGCIKSCSFCSERLLHKKYRARPTQKIIDEISKHKLEGIREFVFHDSLINGDLAALEGLCEAMIRNFGKVKWEAQIAIRNDMSDEIFKKIKASGCYHLFVGLESGCDIILRKMRKGYAAKDAVSFFKKLNRHDISFGISLIAGFPGETQENFEESLRFLIQNKGLIPRIEQVNPFVYYEGIGHSRTDDYRYKDELLPRTERMIEALRKAGYRYTKSFMLNMVEPPWR